MVFVLMYETTVELSMKSYMPVYDRYEGMKPLEAEAIQSLLFHPNCFQLF